MTQSGAQQGADEYVDSKFVQLVNGNVFFLVHVSHYQVGQVEPANKEDAVISDRQGAKEVKDFGVGVPGDVSSEHNWKDRVGMNVEEKAKAGIPAQRCK